MLKMRWLLIALFLFPLASQAQTPKIKNKKYQGLLWEITGKDLKKPSFLFGTMHVSSKLAFHLADSFYLGIKGADVVALETNPETWQADMIKYNKAIERMDELMPGNPDRIPSEYFSKNTLRFYEYENKIENSLQSSPATINSLLYRSYGNDASDFEEDTYLDMYIFQCGKKWGKKVAGVENYDESMRLMAEAYRDAARDKNKKPRYFDRESGFTNDRLQESYRTGNLDWLDSINYYNSTSAAFDEKFMYRRNEIQAESIDSIVRSGVSLFVGVGAAHLPGDRGVIELLRAKGYQLRPVKMGTRDSEHKSQVEKLRVPVQFKPWKSDDGLFQVNVPGDLMAFGDQQSGAQLQYADMANGSYYMVTRIMTNAWLWNHSPGRVLHIVDSLLYENVPGKILSKELVRRNGYEGYTILNKTRRGDVQRSEIYVTPFEVIIFKMSGTGEYVSAGNEADQYFNSIQFTPAKNTTDWVRYSPSFGGYSIELPHVPFISDDGSQLFDAIDQGSGTQFRIIRSTVANHYFASEDSFDLGLMDESLASSEFIEKRISRKKTGHKGFPALDVEYRDKAGKTILARFIIQGPNYYTLMARTQKANAATRRFFQSFELKPSQYGPSVAHQDTMLYYRVNSPVFPVLEPELAAMPIMSLKDDIKEEKDDIQGALYRSRTIEHDSTGEKIFVSFRKRSPYASDVEVTRSFSVSWQPFAVPDSSWLVRKYTTQEGPNGYVVSDWWLSDTGSSRQVRVKEWKRPDRSYTLSVSQDTLSAESSFVRDFFSSFKPADSLFAAVPSEKRADLFFKDLLEGDSVSRARAKREIDDVTLESKHLSILQKAIASLDWKEKNYMEAKKDLYRQLWGINSKEASDYLVGLYHAAGDTTDLQNEALSALLGQRTQYSFQQFRDIVLNEPPIIDGGSGGSNFDITNFRNSYQLPRDYRVTFESPGRFGSGFFRRLTDSFALTRQILPDLLPLLNLEEYQSQLMPIMTQMIDSNQLTAAEYQSYYSKFFLEARMEFRKAVAKTRQFSMEKARREQEGDESSSRYINNSAPRSADMTRYLRLLMPFWEQKPPVRSLVEQIWKSGEANLQYQVASVMIKAGKEVPDSLLQKFAADDEYRYGLFDLLKDKGQSAKFPKAYANVQDLVRGRLYYERSYRKPDSVVYLDRLPVQFGKVKADVFFFKYLDGKNSQWKIASVGLVNKQGLVIERERRGFLKGPANELVYSSDWTEFSDERLKDDEPILDQLKTQLRRLEVGIRPSGEQFYQSGYNNNYLY